MGFDPVEGPGHYEPRRAVRSAEGPGAAAAEGHLPAGCRQAEVAKIERRTCHRLSLPALVVRAARDPEGLVRPLPVHGALHDVDHRFDAGRMRGKRALFCVSTGASAVECGPGGKEGETRLLLWPLAYTLRYCGFDVCRAAAVHGVHGYFEGAEERALETRLAEVLADQARIIARSTGARTMPFNADSDFDATGRLRPARPAIRPSSGCRTRAPSPRRAPA
jgi:NAD(P)H dehydrogenase (quinone)